MTTVAEKVKSLIGELKVKREQLNNRLDLANSAIKTQWQESEEKWAQLEAKYERFGHAVGKSTITLGNDLEQLVAELKLRYLKIQKAAG